MHLGRRSGPGKMKQNVGAMKARRRCTTPTPTISATSSPTTSVQQFLSPEVASKHSSTVVQKEVLRRMEVYVLQILHRYRIQSTAPTTSSAHNHTDAPSTLPPPPSSCAPTTRALELLHRELLVLVWLYSHTQGGTHLTQRDLYYHVCQHNFDQPTVQRVLERFVYQLRLPRQLLGVHAGTRGAVAGSLLAYRGMHLTTTQQHHQDTSSSKRAMLMNYEGFPIPTMEEELRVKAVASLEELDASNTSNNSAPFVVSANTRYIIMVEKHAVFVRLLQEHLLQHLPCVVLTSQGFPTHAARMLMHHLHVALPHVPVIGLVDYNPSGLAILLQYRLGGDGRCGMLEHHATTTSSSSSSSPIRWLGVRREQLSTEAVESGAEFTQRDASVMRRMLNRIEDGDDDVRAWRAEAMQMLACRHKYEVEALYPLQHHQHNSFAEWLAQRLLRRDYL